MSLQLKRRIMIACTALSAIGLAVNEALVITGHSGRYTVPVVVVQVIGILSGLEYLRSTRGRP